MTTREEQLKAFDRLLNIMDELREKCPWDRKQTFETLRPLTIEETYELGDAILDKNLNEVRNELGDLLLHIVFYARLGAEKEAFDIGDVAHQIAEKLIYRHPHIYGDVTAEDEETVKKNWEKLKLKEGKKSIFSGVPRGLPALVKAQRLQHKAAAHNPAAKVESRHDSGPGFFLVRLCAWCPATVAAPCAAANCWRCGAETFLRAALCQVGSAGRFRELLPMALATSMATSATCAAALALGAAVGVVERSSLPLARGLTCWL